MKQDSSNYLELHIDWIVEIRHWLRMDYRDLHTFCSDNNLDYLLVFQFFKGTPIPEDVFKEICGILDFDWEKVSEQ